MLSYLLSLKFLNSHLRCVLIAIHVRRHVQFRGCFFANAVSLKWLLRILYNPIKLWRVTMDEEYLYEGLTKMLQMG